MNGLKTILAMVVAAYIVPKLAALGLSLTGDQQTQIVALGVAGVGILMRFVSTGPALDGARKWFAANVSKSVLDKMTQDEVNKLTDMIIVEMKARFAANKAKEPTK